MVPEDLALTSDIEYPTGLGKASLPAGAAHMREFLAHSPFVRHLGMRLEAIHPDAVRVSMPYRPELATMGDLVIRGRKILGLELPEKRNSRIVSNHDQQTCNNAVSANEGPR